MNIGSALSAASEWPRPDLASIAPLAAAAVPGAEVEWDRDAGEEWARVLLDTAVIAILWARGPLAILVGHHSELATELERCGIATVGVRDWESPELTIDPPEAVRLFGEQWGDTPTSELSAAELWWASV